MTTSPNKMSDEAYADEKLWLPTVEDLIDNAKYDLTGKRQSRKIRKAFGIPEDIIGEQSHQYQEESITSRASRKGSTR